MSRFSCLVLAVSVTAVGPVIAQTVKVEQEIRAMEKLWNESRVRADVAALGTLLSDDWTVTHGDGTINIANTGANLTTFSNTGLAKKSSRFGWVALARCPQRPGSLHV